MRVAVIVPVLNEETSLPLTLESLRNQTYKDFDLIVKDGQSSDRTVEMASRYTEKVISEPDSSPGEARNQAIKHVGKDCSVLVFVDADVDLAPDALERIVEDFERHHPSFIIPKYLPRQEYVRTRGNLIQLPRPAYRPWYVFQHLFRKYIDNYGSGECMPVDAAIFKRVGGFREGLRVCEDIELSYRLRREAKALVDADVVVYASTRRYLREGIIRGLLSYFVYRIMWHLGLRQPLRAAVSWQDS